MAKIRVLEVATFYTMFNLAPVGRLTSSSAARRRACCAAPRSSRRCCQARSASQEQVTADGLFSWIEVECLGACCNAPMVQINDDYYEDLTPENFAKLLDDLAAGRPVRTGSQIGRGSSEPVGGLTRSRPSTGRRQGRQRARAALRRRDSRAVASARRQRSRAFAPAPWAMGCCSSPGRGARRTASARPQAAS